MLVAGMVLASALLLTASGRLVPVAKGPVVVMLGRGGAANDAFYKAFRQTFTARHPFLATQVRWVTLPLADSREAHAHNLRRIAAEGVDLIVARNAAQAELAHEVVPASSLLFWSHVDPRRIGVVAELTRPGGTATGLWVEDELDAKRIELLLDAYPSVQRIGLLVDRSWLESGAGLVPGLQAFARARNAQLELVSAATLEAAVDQVDGPAKAIEAWYLPRSVISADGSLAQRLSERGKVVVAAYTPDIENGAHLSYAHDRTLVQPALADLAARILQGEPAGSIPVQTLHRYQLAVRLSNDARLPPLNPAVVRRADLVLRP